MEEQLVSLTQTDGNYDSAILILADAVDIKVRMINAKIVNLL